jgi:hypothetical protein
MTKLEEEIRDAIAENSATYPDEEAVKAAAEVAKRYIEKAWKDSKPQYTIKPSGVGYNIFELDYQQWLKDNGITE